MTRENQPSDGIKRSKGKFDFVNEKRDWSAALSEEYCKKIAKAAGKKLIEVVDTEAGPLPVICIFEGYLDE
jgi:hypothetical protein